jgi:hypothetical protein
VGQQSVIMDEQRETMSIKVTHVSRESDIQELCPAQKAVAMHPTPHQVILLMEVAYDG